MADGQTNKIKLEYLQKALNKAKPPVKKDKIRNEKNAELILAEIASGKSLRQICRVNEWAYSTVFEWITVEYSDQYTRARELQAECLFDELLDIADNGVEDCSVDKDGNKIIDAEALQRKKIRIDTRKFFISKVLPKKYGDRVGVDLNGEVGLTYHDKSISELNELFSQAFAMSTSGDNSQSGKK